MPRRKKHRIQKRKKCKMKYDNSIEKPETKESVEEAQANEGANGA